jgi:hypothetical protein
MIHRRHLPALIPAIGAALAPGARAANEREAPGALMVGTAAFGMRVSVNARGTAFICGAGAETASPAAPVLRAWSISPHGGKWRCSLACAAPPPTPPSRRGARRWPS